MKINRAGLLPRPIRNLRHRYDNGRRSREASGGEKIPAAFWADLGLRSPPENRQFSPGGEEKNQSANAKLIRVVLHLGSYLTCVLDDRYALV